MKLTTVSQLAIKLGVTRREIQRRALLLITTKETAMNMALRLRNEYGVSWCYHPPPNSAGMININVEYLHGGCWYAHTTFGMLANENSPYILQLLMDSLHVKFGDAMEWRIKIR
jgi:hypothetical protein